MSVVFMFLPRPVAALRECRRVMRRVARLAIYTTGPELRGTPAAPEPLAHRTYFYTDTDLETVARDSGLVHVKVINDQGGQLLTALSPGSASE